MGNYFYRICAGGIICGVIKRFGGEKHREIINFITSVIICTTILHPLQNFKCVSFDAGGIWENGSDSALALIYSDELKKELNLLLSDNEYNAAVGNIYCECKDGEIEVIELTYNGDISAGDYLSDVSGISRDRVIYSG